MPDMGHEGKAVEVGSTARVGALMMLEVECTIRQKPSALLSFSKLYSISSTSSSNLGSSMHSHMSRKLYIVCKGRRILLPFSTMHSNLCNSMCNSLCSAVLLVAVGAQ